MKEVLKEADNSAFSVVHHWGLQFLG